MCNPRRDRNVTAPVSIGNNSMDLNFDFDDLDLLNAVVHNGGACEIDFPSLGVVWGGAISEHHRHFPQTDTLSNIGSTGMLAVTSNSGLTSLDLSSLHNVEGILGILNNFQLLELSFPSLSLCTGLIFVGSNQQLKGVTIVNFARSARTTSRASTIQNLLSSKFELAL